MTMPTEEELIHASERLGTLADQLYAAGLKPQGDEALDIAMSIDPDFLPELPSE